ncbi:MAG: hypothetical protein RLZZ292_910, partial [Bacteroidota bacterium]
FLEGAAHRNIIILGCAAPSRNKIIFCYKYFGALHLLERNSPRFGRGEREGVRESNFKEKSLFPIPLYHQKRVLRH